jgi:hypothetical protein
VELVEASTPFTKGLHKVFCEDESVGDRGIKLRF